MQTLIRSTSGTKGVALHCVVCACGESASSGSGDAARPAAGESAWQARIATAPARRASARRARAIRRAGSAPCAGAPDAAAELDGARCIVSAAAARHRKDRDDTEDDTADREDGDDGAGMDAPTATSGRPLRTIAAHS